MATYIRVDVENDDILRRNRQQTVVNRSLRLETRRQGLQDAAIVNARAAAAEPEPGRVGRLRRRGEPAAMYRQKMFKPVVAFGQALLKGDNVVIKTTLHYPSLSGTLGSVGPCANAEKLYFRNKLILTTRGFYESVLLDVANYRQIFKTATKAFLSFHMYRLLPTPNPGWILNARMASSYMVDNYPVYTFYPAFALTAESAVCIEGQYVGMLAMDVISLQGEWIPP